MRALPEISTRPADRPTGQSWNASHYAANGRFVATMAGAVMNLLAPAPGERILDVGCGDGALTEQLAASGAVVTGIDASAEMAAAAKTRSATLEHPFTVEHLSVQRLTFVEQFDAVFSNAALHWIPADTQATALAAIHRSLHPGGRFVAEMGGQGNIAAIRTALQATLAPFGIDAEQAAASFYPSPAQYRQMLEAAGFEVRQIDLIPRPTPLPGGPEGMAIWLNTFRNGVLDRLAPSDRATAITRTVDLLRPMLSDPQGEWTADYVRLRFHAIRSPYKPPRQPSPLQSPKVLRTKDLGLDFGITKSGAYLHETAPCHLPAPRHGATHRLTLTASVP